MDGRGECFEEQGSRVTGNRHSYDGVQRTARRALGDRQTRMARFVGFPCKRRKSGGAPPQSKTLCDNLSELCLTTTDS